MNRRYTGMGMEAQRYPQVGAATMLGFTAGLGTAVVAGHSASQARARVQVLDRRADALLALEFGDPTAQRLRDTRLQLLRFERSSPAYVAQRNGRAAITGALLAVGSLAAGSTFAATRD